MQTPLPEPSLFLSARQRTTDPLLPGALQRRDGNGCELSPRVLPQLSIAPAAQQRFCASKCRWGIWPRAARRFVLPSLCSAVSGRRVTARLVAVPSAGFVRLDRACAQVWARQATTGLTHSRTHSLRVFPSIAQASLIPHTGGELQFVESNRMRWID